MFDFTIDSKLPSRISTVVFESSDDMDYVQKSVARLRKELPEATYRVFENHGHFCAGDIGLTFPALLEECLK
jgi:hypothetical protein